MANLLPIRELCKSRHITQRQLAQQIGITEGQLHTAIRTGRTSLETLEKIAAILQVHPGIFFDSPHKSNPEADALRARLNTLKTQLKEALNGI